MPGLPVPLVGFVSEGTYSGPVEHEGSSTDGDSAGRVAGQDSRADLRTGDRTASARTVDDKGAATSVEHEGSLI